MEKSQGEVLPDGIVEHLRAARLERELAERALEDNPNIILGEN